MTRGPAPKADPNGTRPHRAPQSEERTMATDRDDVCITVRRSAVRPLPEGSRDGSRWQHASVTMPLNSRIGGQDVGGATFLQRLWWEGHTKRGHERISDIHTGHDQDGHEDGTIYFYRDADRPMSLRVYDRDPSGRRVRAEDGSFRRHDLEVSASDVARAMAEALGRDRSADRDVCLTFPEGTRVTYVPRKTKDGRDYQSAAVTLPKGTRASGHDLSGKTLWVDPARGTTKAGKPYDRIRDGEGGTRYLYVPVFPDLRIADKETRQRVSVDPRSLAASLRRTRGEGVRTPDQIREQTRGAMAATAGRGGRDAQEFAKREQGPLR